MPLPPVVLNPPKLEAPPGVHLFQLLELEKADAPCPENG